MISPAPYLRETIFNLLDGNVVYNAQTIPVFENEGEDSEDLQIIISSYSDADAGTTNNFGSQARQEIQIISMQRTAARKVVDAVGELVAALISPTPTSDNLSGVDFHVNVQGKPSLRHLTEDVKGGEIAVRLIMNYDLLITHKTT